MLFHAHQPVLGRTYYSQHPPKLVAVAHLLLNVCKGELCLQLVMKHAREAGVLCRYVYTAEDIQRMVEGRRTKGRAANQATHKARLQRQLEHAIDTENVELRVRCAQSAGQNLRDWSCKGRSLEQFSMPAADSASAAREGCLCSKACSSSDWKQGGRDPHSLIVVRLNLVCFPRLDYEGVRG